MLKNYILLLQIVCGLSLSWSAEQITPFLIQGIPNEANISTAPFTKIGDGYYYIEQKLRLNWYQAYESCRLIGAELISFETVEEWDALVNQLGERKSRKDRSEYWTSGNDLGKEGKHNWFRNAQPISINKWAPNQPDNAGGREHCVHLGYIYGHSKTLELNDRPCNSKNSLLSYICEASKPQTVSFIFWQ
ncbi:C-type lectin 37Da-like [Scaptodrosophila lebanonensis]|uniref:C-type lectin 37Da-like n=1 Tax=Drosophila lebanonensis TaxID=7225 RepID=A0A6J2TM43_DROLE|nr:C-type lectin 37Da-like [Scaptodrosophila lebanonensis]